MINNRGRVGRIGAGAFVLLALTSCTETVTPPTPPAPTLSVAAPVVGLGPTTTPSPTPTPAADVNPLTGEGPIPTGSVVAVKIDDTANGRPQRGVDLADIVYIEQAEGGLSRLIAVFATNKPLVEPVRSVRTSDPELLSEYGAITLVASGGGGLSLPTLKASILMGVIDDWGDSGFSRDNDRNAPYNLEANLATITADEPKGNPPQDIGFTWSSTPPIGAAPGGTLATKVGGTDVGFTWDAALGKYVRVIDGVNQRAADGNPIATPNVIVQFVSVTPDYSDIDVDGHPSQYTHSIGTGAVSVFRNGVRVDGTWSRASLTAGTTLTSAAGTPIALAPGGAWVLLVATGTALTST